MLTSLSKLTKLWVSNGSGTVSVLYAFLLVILCSTSGLAIDMANTFRRKQDAQRVLDSAVLAALRADEIEQGRSTFFRFAAAGGLTPSSLSLDTFKNGSSYRAQATYRGQSATYFAKMMSFPTMMFDVESSGQAPTKLSSFSIEIKNASGASDKNVKFVVVHTDGTQEVVATINYDASTHSTTIGPSSTVAVKDLKSLWVEMDVVTSWGAKASFSTKSKSQANHVFIDGRQLDPGETATTTLLPCDTDADYALEDTMQPLGAMQWDHQDIFFKVSTTCERPDGAMAHLTK